MKALAKDAVKGIAQNVLLLDNAEVYYENKKLKEFNNELNELNKKLTDRKGSGLKVANIKIKYVMKVINSLEYRWIFLKGSTKQITSQKGGFLNFLRPLMSIGLPLTKNLLTPWAKSVVFPLGLTTAVSSTDEAIQKKISGSGTALIIFDKEINDIMKVIKYLEDSGLLVKDVRKTIKIEAKERKGGFLGY